MCMYIRSDYRYHGSIIAMNDEVEIDIVIHFHIVSLLTNTYVFNLMSMILFVCEFT